MGIERDRVFHINFEQGEDDAKFLNLASNATKDLEIATKVFRTKAIDPLFGSYSLDATSFSLGNLIEFSNPEDIRPSNNKTFDFRFAIQIPTALIPGTYRLFEEEGAEFWRVLYQLDGAGDRIEIDFSQSTVKKTFVFDFGVGAFTRDVWLVFRITFDKTTMRCYLNGVKHGTDVSKASVMTGDWDDADGTVFRISSKITGWAACYFDHILLERGAPSVFTGASYTLETESFQREAPVFPVASSQGTGVGPGFKTDVLRIESGHELRETANINNRNRFTVSLVNKKQSELENLIALTHIMRGRGRVFRYKDWLEFKTTTPDGTIGISDQTIGIGDGTTTAFQLTKTFFKDTEKNNVDHIRTITRPVLGTVRVSIDDVETFAFRIDYGSGKIFFTTAPAADEVIKWGGEYDVPCRFDNDDIRLNMKAFRNGDSSFDLKEVANG